MYNLADDDKTLFGLFIMAIICIAIMVSVYIEYRKIPNYVNIVVNSTEYILDREEQKAVSDFISHLQEVK